MGKRGTVVIPAPLRRRYGFDEGSMVLAEARPDGVLIRPAKVVPVEIDSDERRAEFLLSNAIGQREYEKAMREVLAMGLDHATIPHHRPRGS